MQNTFQKYFWKHQNIKIDFRDAKRQKIKFGNAKRRNIIIYKWKRFKPKKIFKTNMSNFITMHSFISPF